MRKFITYNDRVLPVHHPRVIVETAVELGAPHAPLFENTELTAEMLTSPQMRVSYHQYAVLCVNALRLTGNPALGLHVGRNTNIAQNGVVGFVMMNSPTLGAALQVLLRYAPVITPAWEFSLELGKDTAALTFRETIELGPLKTFAHEVMLASYDTQTRTLYRRPLPIQGLDLPYPAPPYAHLYREFFYDVPMRFEQPIARVEFPPDLLDARIPYADPATLQLAEQFAAKLLPLDDAQEGLVGQVRRLLAAETGPPPSFPDIARTLQTSTRTLRRELASMRTSYKDLVDESRRIRAEAWMETNSLPIERLATALGFSTVGSFRRAYKRWTGRTPSETRSRH